MSNEGGDNLRDVRAALRGTRTPSLLLSVDRRPSSDAVDLWPIYRAGRSPRQREGAQDNPVRG